MIIARCCKNGDENEGPSKVTKKFAAEKFEEGNETGSTRIRREKTSMADLYFN